MWVRPPPPAPNRINNLQELFDKFVAKVRNGVVALSLYRLHSAACVGYYKRHDRTGKSCKCMIHVEGMLGDDLVRSSTHTRTWTRAARLVKDAETAGIWTDTRNEDERPTEAPASGKLISEAVEEFLSECRDVKGRNLAGPTLGKYVTVLTRLKTYAQQQGLTRLDELDFPQLNAFKRTWPTGPLATVKTISRLRAFFAHAVKSKWCRENVARELPMPSNTLVERMPFTEDEMAKILAAARTIKLNSQQPVTNEEIETFILVQRWAGLAISDTALLQKSEIRGDEVRYYRKKMIRSERRILVVVPLPPDVLARLKKLPLQKGRYYFAHGVDSITTQVEAWRKRLAMVFEEAKVRGTSHQFRHTFATDLLTRDVSVERVARWLGNSTRICEKHYSHWIESRVQSASDVLREINAKRV